MAATVQREFSSSTVNLEKISENRLCRAFTKPAWKIGYMEMHEGFAFNQPPYMTREKCSEWQDGWTTAFQDVIKSFNEEG